MMDGAEPPGSASERAPYPPADGRLRVLARGVDLVVPAMMLFAPVAAPRAMALCAAALVLCSDSLFGAGRSLGKRLFGLRVVLLRTRRPAPLGATLKRNAIFALAL